MWQYTVFCVPALLEGWVHTCKKVDFSLRAQMSFIWDWLHVLKLKHNFVSLISVKARVSGQLVRHRRSPSYKTASKDLPKTLKKRNDGNQGHGDSNISSRTLTNNTLMWDQGATDINKSLSGPPAIISISCKWWKIRKEHWRWQVTNCNLTEPWEPLWALSRCD